jgi:hypothetical protein
MTVWKAFTEGLRRVIHAPALVAGLWLMTFLLAWPLALTLRGMLAEHLGASLAADTAASGMNFDWWNEFLAQAAGLGQTFVPAILGFAAVLKNLSGVADAQGLPTVIGSAITANIVISVFLMGGVLDRLARDRRTGAYGFFAACGTCFFRFLRLGLVAGAVYWLLFTYVHRQFFDELYPLLTHDLTVERTALIYRAVLYLVFGLIVVTFNVWFDYAKIRMVVEDRRSAIGALTASARFLGRQQGAVFALYFLNMLIFLLVIGLYAVLAPGAAGGAAAWIGFIVGQLYIVARVFVRLQFAASQIALFQGRLAHAGYVAAPVPTWPDSPAAEAIRPE